VSAPAESQRPTTRDENAGLPDHLKDLLEIADELLDHVQTPSRWHVTCTDERHEPYKRLAADIQAAVARFEGFESSELQKGFRLVKNTGTARARRAEDGRPA
jgi:hypothetical protein